MATTTETVSVTEYRGRTIEVRTFELPAFGSMGGRYYSATVDGLEAGSNHRSAEDAETEARGVIDGIG